MRRVSTTRRERRRHRQRGLTLVEVLVSFVILAIISLAVLELFSLSVAVNMGSKGRTELTYRAQMVAETVRLQAFLAQQTPATNNACCPLAAGSYALPTAGCDTFWGPDGVNAWYPGAPYQLDLDIQQNGTLRQVTVTAFPVATASQGNRILFRAVRYVAQI
ncbi:MAG: type IV pilus modification PilV family protein [Acidobacteriota bacterium]